ncbi:alpha-xenorhabdolysin family binary toxin subunit A [Pseudomonas sp. R1-7]|uniref:alpha-xenorhabdolysin family binary toxin subunit A n=1 Tax=Pseudomonas sp. R1-7 TaxID=2817398 RepID=UPI003DA7C525
MLTIDDFPITAGELNALTMNFINAASGTLPGVQREKGLLVTTSDIRNIKNYVVRGLALPTDTAQIEQIYKYDQLKINGLRSEDMQVLYETIKSHAETWPAIETGMKAVGSGLHVFADELTNVSEAIIGYLENLPSYVSGIGKIGDLTPEEIENLPEIRLSSEELRRTPVLLELVKELKGLIQHHSTKTSATKAQITQFKNGIGHSIKPALDLKLTLINSQNASEEIKQHNERLDILGQRIRERQAEIESYSKNKWWGLFGGAVGFTITATIYGQKAKEARQELELLVSERRMIVKSIETNHQLLAHLNAFESDIHDLRIRVENAVGSSSNLENLWELIQAYVDASSRKLDGVTNAMYLVAFSARLSSMMSHWKNIQEQARDLLNAFSNAVEETLFSPTARSALTQMHFSETALPSPTPEKYTMTGIDSVELATDYVLPDVKIIHACRDELNYKISILNNLHIPVLVEEFNALRKETSNAYDEAKRAITRIPVSLQTVEIVSLIDTIERIRENPTAEQQQAIESLSQEIKQLINNALSETDKYAIAFDDSLANLRAVTLSDNQYRIQALEETIRQSELPAAAEKAAIERLLTDEGVLNESIKLIESTDSFSLIKELLLTASNLAVMNPSPTQLKLIQAGMDVAGRLLGLVSDAIKYGNLIEARRQIQVELDRRRQTSAHKQNELQMLRDRHQLLLEAQSVRATRDTYHDEMSRLAGAISQFLNINNHGASATLETVAQTFLSQAGILTRHLNTLLREWRN